jgi:hypothetical protein
LNRNSERIPRSLLRGWRANLRIAHFLTVAAKHCRWAEHSLQLAAGFFNYNSNDVLCRELLGMRGAKKFMTDYLIRRSVMTEKVKT